MASNELAQDRPDPYPASDRPDRAVGTRPGPEAMLSPPVPRRTDGTDRHIGIELEFAGLDARLAADLVRDCFGGDIQFRDPHRFIVQDTRFGDFTVELDTIYAHPSPIDGDPATGPLDKLGQWMDDTVSSTIGDLTVGLVPTEVVSPPIPLQNLPEMSALTDALRRAGAQGTDESTLYAFGLQLNPEVPDEGAESLLAHLQAFVLLEPWLRKEIHMDMTRRVLAYAEPYPRAYVARLLSEDYQPDRAQLIDDYVSANPTRNRGLDLLPLFSHLDPDRVRRRLNDPRVKARPTFHYRLPDTRLSDPDWTIVREWNRWLQVERLAADHDRRRAMMAAFRPMLEGWPELFAANAVAWLDH